MPQFRNLPLVLVTSLCLLSSLASAETRTNLALGKPARQSSEYKNGAAPASLAVDGITDGKYSVGSVTHTSRGSDGGSRDPWWEVDLGKDYELSELILHKRTDCCLDRWTEFNILVRSSGNGDWRQLYHEKLKERKKWQLLAAKGSIKEAAPVLTLNSSHFVGQPPVRYIRVQIPGEGAVLSIAEVQAFGAEAGARARQMADTTTCNGPYGSVQYADFLGHGEIILFTQANYRGECREITYKDEGPYAYSVATTFPEKGYFRFDGNRTVNSMKIGPGIVVTACTGKSLTGKCKEYTEDVPYLGPQELGSAVNSLRIFTLDPKDYDPGKPKPDQIYACGQSTGKGRACRFYGMGDNKLGSLDGRLESLRLGADVKVFVCTDRKFRGTCRIYKSDISSLSEDGIGPIHSLRVLGKDEPDPSIVVAEVGTPLTRSLNNKLFTIQSVETGQCLTAGGSSGQLETCSGETDQLWGFISATSGRYFIRTSSLGQGIEATALDSTPVVHVVAVADSDSEQDQQWDVTQSAQGNILIRSALADKNLEASSPVSLRYGSNLPGQQWMLDEVGEVEVVDQDPTQPSPGSIVANVRLTGDRLNTLSFESRGARRGCERACKDDWSCKGYSVDAWAGQCILLSKVVGSEPASGWESQIRASRARARVPAHGQYAENTRLTGANLAVSQVVNTRDCLAACEADERCMAFSKSGDGQCELKSEIGEATAAQHWTSWRRPRDESVPPDQTMASSLCQNHSPAFPAYALTTSPYTYQTSAKLYMDLPSVIERGPIQPPKGVMKFDGSINFTSAFYLRALPDGTVHFHSWYNPDVVLKRRDGQVIAGEPDEHSAWRLEYLFDHVDPPADGIWIVIRNPETGSFLTMHGRSIKLTHSSDNPATHWRYDRALLPGQKKETTTPLPIVERPPTVLDQEVVAALVEWSVTELVREEQTACWKEGGSGDCPTGQDVDCGLFCAQSTMQCVMDVVDMVSSVGIVAANVAGAAFTGGTANVAIKSAQTVGKTGGKLAAKTAMRQAMKTGGRALQKNLKKRLGARVIRFMRTRGRSESFKKLAKDVAMNARRKITTNVVSELKPSPIKDSVGVLTEMEQEKAEEDLVQAYADEVALQTGQQFALIVAAGEDPDLLEIAAMVDPTGVLDVVNSFNKPTCTETPMPDL